MIPITYSLKGNYTSSNLYYNTIKNFTDEVINESRRELLPIIKKYIDFINKNKLEELRTEVEYLFDFLTLGISWKIYLIQALNLTYPEYYVLSKLYLLRRRNKKIKPFVDKVRGIIATISLRRKFSGIKKLKSYGKKELVKLLRWMEASGEFREEVKRLNLVKLYFKNKSRDEFNYDLKILLDFSNWFEEKAEKDLNKFTPEVNNFIKKNYKKFLWKEDVIFCGRKEAEYHLSMIGAELMNRAFKQDFEKSDKKALLLPACMKLLPEEKCKAKKFSLDYICTGCSPKCRINHYRKEGIEKGFEVHIIPHSSDFTTWLQNWAAGKNIGVVGVACPLNLITGGLELKSLNIPAQCVLLDYCGCKNHWHEKGIPTDINEGELFKILGKKENKNSVAA